MCMAKTATRSPVAALGKSHATAGKAARFVRKQLLITPEQNRRMKALAAAVGKTEAELFREAVEAMLEAAEKQDSKAALLSAAGLWADFAEIDDIVADARKRRRLRHKLATNLR